MGGQEWASIGRRSSTAALSYENLIVSHTKANRLSILRERLSLYRAKPPSGLHVLRLHPSSCRPLECSLSLSCLLSPPLALFPPFFLPGVGLTLSRYPSRSLFFPWSSFYRFFILKMHRGIFKLMHLSLFLCATGVREAINLSISIISCVGSLPFLSDQLLMPLMVMESLKNFRLIFP